MTDLPAPLTPAAADLQDFPFMPLHVARLRDSDLAAEVEPEACWYAVLLWGASWHQLPAGSLPDNDAVLMRLVGLGRDARTWRKHRDGALRGFVKCADGRLYHPVVAEQVQESWRKKLEQRWRTECARIRKANQRTGADDPQPTLDEWLAANGHIAELATAPAVPSDNPMLSHGTSPVVPRETPSKGQRQGQGQGQGLVEEGEVARARAPDAFPRPAWADPQHWSDFLANRRRRARPNTATAHKRLLDDIERLSSDEWPPGRLLEHAAAHGWAGIYDPKDDRHGRSSHHRNGSDDGLASLRGSRPNPAVDMYLQADAELRAAGAA